MVFDLRENDRSTSAAVEDFGQGIEIGGRPASINSARFIDDQRSSEKVPSITGEDAQKGLFVSQFDETEASGLTREPVDGNRHRLGGKTVAFEPLMQLILVRVVGQIPYEYLLSQCSAAFLTLLI